MLIVIWFVAASQKKLLFDEISIIFAKKFCKKKEP